MNGEREKRKLKSRILSVVVIFIGIALVFAGYLAMQRLLQRRQERLLSQSGEIRTTVDEESEMDDEERVKLSADELEDILVRSAFVGETNPHEPYGRQMTMQEAIETGQAWIDSFCAKYGYPNAGGAVSYEGISAALYTGQMNNDLLDSVLQNEEETQTESQTVFEPGVELSEDSGNALSESMYGYWELTFSGSDMNIVLRLNAVTGQALYVSMECSSYTVSIEGMPLSTVISEYAESFELGNMGDVSAIYSEENGAMQTDIVNYEGEIFFTINSYVYGAAELGYPEDSGYTQSGFTMYAGVGY